MTYIVTSALFGEVGATVTEEDLANLNIPALIEAGHIAAPKPSRQTGDDKEK